MSLRCTIVPLAIAGGAMSICSWLSALTTAAPSARGDDPWADQIVAYDAGLGAAPGYADASTTLGHPERFTGEGVFPGAVTAFNSAFGTDEIVSIGEGGMLEVRFDTPVLDDSDNPYGIDLLIFGNALFVFDGAGVGNPAGLFADPASIEVSADGLMWFNVPGVFADDLFPTEGYLDLTDPFATAPGLVESDFTRPVDPALSLDDFAGLTYAQVLSRYRGSGGGAGVDLASVGLPAISHVRITVPADAGFNAEIDAFADVAPRMPGDADLDGIINVTDLLLLLSGWGVPSPGSPPVDMNGDGIVNVSDLLILLANWS